MQFGNLKTDPLFSNISIRLSNYQIVKIGLTCFHTPGYVATDAKNNHLYYANPINLKIYAAFTGSSACRTFEFL